MVALFADEGVEVLIASVTEELSRPADERLRLRLLSVAGRIISTGRRHILRLSRRWPWSDLLIDGQRNLAALI